MKNLKKAVNRLLKALEKKERIIIYGDADLDGVASVIVLEEALANLGGQASRIYFSDRRREEPGLNQEALELLKDQAPALLIVVDCGISNFEEAKLAKKLGFEVLMFEHHEVLDKLPEAKIIVNPKTETKTSPFYHLATVGVVFKLIELLLKEKMTRSLRENFLELAALATIADMVPPIGENQAIVEEGLGLLESSWRPAIKIIFNSSLVHGLSSTREMVQKAINVINITDKEEGTLGLAELYLFLTASTPEEAQSRFTRFLEKGSERQKLIEEWADKFKDRVFLKETEPIIFEGSSDLPQSLLGTMASRLCDFFEKPTFLYKMTLKENVGHFRMPEGLSGIEALGTCAKILRRYGGHGAAGGFYFQEKDSAKLQDCLENFFVKKLKLKKK